MNLFVWQCGEVIATGSEMLSLSHCAVPFLFRALSDWASECFPIEIIIRSESGYSQEQFANRIDMDRSYYASIEVGRRNVSLSNLSKIANGFNISIAALMTGVSDKTD